MNGYRHIAKVTAEVHEALMRWSRRVLLDAGLDTVDVYGQFPPQGTVSSHLVVFLYQVSPDPKLIEHSKGASLLGGRDRRQDRVSLIPRPWLEVGAAVRMALYTLFAEAARSPNERQPGPVTALPYPLVEELPAPLAVWYRDRMDQKGSTEVWVAEDDGKRYALPPSLWWYPGITLTTRYVVVAGEPGRGTMDRTSSSAPLSLTALSVLATGIQLEKELTAPLPPLPFAENLESYVHALADSLDVFEAEEGGLEYSKQLAAGLRRSLEGVKEEALASFGITPVHDLSNHEFALLMQALQRPLQAALNLMLRLRLGASCVFSPSTSVGLAQHKPDPGEPLGSKRASDEDARADSSKSAQS